MFLLVSFTGSVRKVCSESVVVKQIGMRFAISLFLSGHEVSRVSSARSYLYGCYRQVLLPTGNPILLGIWIIIAVGGTYAYFVYLPSTYASDKEIPPFVQVPTNLCFFSYGI